MNKKRIVTSNDIVYEHQVLARQVIDTEEDSQQRKRWREFKQKLWVEK